MIKFRYSTVLPLALASLAFLFILSSCSDKKDDVDPAAKKYRLKTMSSEDGTQILHFKYNSDNRIEKMSITKNGIENEKEEWAWDGNTVTISYSILENGTWQSDSDPKVLTYENGKLVKSQELSDSPVITTFNWNGDLLLYDVKAFYYGDSIMSVYTKSYSYTDGQLTSVHYNLNNMIGLRVIEYQNGKPALIKSYSYERLTEKIGFSYTGDNITHVTKYDIDYDGNEQGIKCIETRTYDANNMLASITDQCNSETRIFTYEEGVGNTYDDFIAIGSWIGVYFFPNAFPSALVR